MAAHRSTALFPALLVLARSFWWSVAQVKWFECGTVTSEESGHRFLSPLSVSTVLPCLAYYVPHLPLSSSALSSSTAAQSHQRTWCGGMWWVWLNGRSLYSLASPVASDRFLLWWGCEVPPLQINVWLFNWVTFNIQPFVCVSWLFIVTFFKCFSSFNKEFFGRGSFVWIFLQSWSYDIFCKGTAVTWDFPHWRRLLCYLSACKQTILCKCLVNANHVVFTKH